MFPAADSANRLFWRLKYNGAAISISGLKNSTSGSGWNELGISFIKLNWHNEYCWKLRYGGVMKSMIKLLGIITLVAGIGFPVIAQPRPINEAIRVIQPQANNVNNLLHRSLSDGEKHFYRVNNLTDSFYYIMWRDSDNSRNLNAPYADIKVTILNITNNSVIVSGVDVDRSFNEEREINSIEITRNTHYTNGNDILIIVEGLDSESSGSYAIIVH